MNRKLVGRTVVAVVCGWAVIGGAILLRALWPVIVEQGLGIVLLAIAVAGAIWLYDWYTDQKEAG